MTRSLYKKKKKQKTHTKIKKGKTNLPAPEKR